MLRWIAVWVCLGSFCFSPSLSGQVGQRKQVLATARQRLEPRIHLAEKTLANIEAEILRQRIKLAEAIEGKKPEHEITMLQTVYVHSEHRRQFQLKDLYHLQDQARLLNAAINHPPDSDAGLRAILDNLKNSEPGEVAPIESGEWESIFNGVNLNGWTAKIRGYEAGHNFADTFRVRDGCLVVDYDGYNGQFNDRFGHLFWQDSLDHYVLRVEYRFVGEQVAGGPGWAWRNSGVMIHGQTPDSMARDQSFPVSIEVQLLGGDGSQPRTNANLCTPGTHVEMNGALVTDHCINSSSDTFHGDRWVTVEIEVRGNEVIRHTIDGRVVLEYQKPQLDPADGNAQKLIAGDAIQLSGGTISLQSESHPIEFRRVEVKHLDP